MATRRTASAGLALVACLSLGCAGALWSDGSGKVLLPLSLGNSEFVAGDGEKWSCTSGGPVSEGFVGLVADVVQGALGIFTGRDPGEDDPSQDTERHAGCFARVAPEPPA